MDNKSLKKFISDKYNITVTICKVYNETENHFYTRCDYWTTNFDYCTGNLIKVSKIEILKMLRKEKLNNINNK